MDQITTNILTLKSGNIVTVFLNRNTNLLVIDIIDKSEKGGNEIMRQHLDENELLKHVPDLPPVEQPEPSHVDKNMNAYDIKGGLKFHHKED